jgi:hypothetical protein
MSALTGIKSIADKLEDDPDLAPVRSAVQIAATLVPRMTSEDYAYLAAELAASLAIMEECAGSALLERGRVRRKLLEIARGKCIRARCQLEPAVVYALLRSTEIAHAHAALEAAEAALAPPARLPLSALLRR